MNPLLLMLKQMRQRALSTWLTLLSVALGVGLAVAIMIMRREGSAVFGQTDYGYDVLVGPKGSPLQLVLNTVYHIDSPPGTISYSLYENFLPTGQWFRYAKVAVPVTVGDNYKGHAIVGTTPRLLGGDDHGNVNPETAFEVRPGQRYTFAEGRCFEPRKFEAVVGSEVAAKHVLNMGSTFQATHGLDPAGTDIHPEVWKIVGVLAPTHTASDQIILIPIISFYAIGDHKAGLEQIAKVRAAEQGGAGKHPNPVPIVTTEPETAPAAEAGAADSGGDVDNDGPAAYTLTPEGNIALSVGKEKWQISAILVKSRGGIAGIALTDTINKGTVATAVNPAYVMAGFFKTFLEGTTRVSSLLSSLVTIVAAISILVSIYNSISARNREIAILRALGATRGRILRLICLEAGAIGLIGGLLGIILGHALAAAGSAYLTILLGEGIPWWRTDIYEWLYWLIVIGIALLAGLVPALKAYRTPVAANLNAV